MRSFLGHHCEKGCMGYDSARSVALLSFSSDCETVALVNNPRRAHARRGSTMAHRLLLSSLALVVFWFCGSWPGRGPCFSFSASKNNLKGVAAVFMPASPIPWSPLAFQRQLVAGLREWLFFRSPSSVRAEKLETSPFSGGTWRCYSGITVLSEATGARRI